MPGFPPQPTALKKLRGNPGRRPLNNNEPKPQGSVGRPPKHLNAEAKKEWRWVMKVAPEGMLTAADASTLELYCQLRADIRERLKERVDPETGEIIRGKWHPQEIVQLRGLIAALGLDPASRSRLQVAPTDEADPLAEWLKSKHRQ